MKLAQEHKVYLSNKHTGGVNNQKGNTYETIFATKEIVRLFAEGYDIKTTWLSAQCENAFVDDFIIRTPSLKIYHQLKDKQDLSWGKYESGQLLYDFIWQRSYSLSNKENFKLKIVYSHSDCNIHKKAVPQKIADVTVKEYFPSYESLTSLLQTSETIRHNLTSILNYPGYDIPLDMQSASLEFIRSQWLELSTPGKWISLAEIKDSYDKKHPECPNFKDVPNVKLPSEVVDILTRISGFLFTISGSNIYWKFNKMQGQTAVTEIWLTTILSAKPINIQQLLPLLN